MNPLAPAEAGQALRALPLGGEEISTSKCNPAKYVNFSPLPGEMARSARGVSYVGSKAAQGRCRNAAEGFKYTKTSLSSALLSSETVPAEAQLSESD